MRKTDRGAIMKLRLALLVLCACAAASTAAGKEPPVLRGVVLTPDRTVDATSSASIAKGLFSPGMTEQQKAYTLWRFFLRRNRHKEKAAQQDPGNAAELMTKTGYALCGTWADHFAALAADVGLTSTRVGLNGHWVTAEKYWGGWHAYDADMLAVYA